MKRTCMTIALVAMVGMGTQAFADDQASSSASMSAQHRQMMKDCMDQQKAKDSSMSKADMRKACKDQMKMSKPDTPNQTTPTTKGEPAPQSGNEMNPSTEPPK